MPATFEELLQEYDLRAKAHLDAIRACAPEPQNDGFLHDRLLDYVRCKFMLEPEECSSEILAELSAASIAKVTGIPKGDLANQDLSMNCAGVSSVETKKILLLIALQRAFAIRIDPDLAPEIQTIDDLTAMIREAFAKQ